MNGVPSTQPQDGLRLSLSDFIVSELYVTQSEGGIFIPSSQLAIDIAEGERRYHKQVLRTDFALPLDSVLLGPQQPETLYRIGRTNIRP